MEKEPEGEVVGCYSAVRRRKRQTSVGGELEMQKIKVEAVFLLSPKEAEPSYPPSLFSSVRENNWILHERSLDLAVSYTAPVLSA